MNLYIYSDESGVFDQKNNDLFVFAGLLLLGTQEKDKWSRKYSNAEKTMREKLSLNHSIELKASNIPNDLKGKLFRSLNHCHKFAAIIEQKNVLERIFDSKKDKQRYLDYVYKVVVKKALEDLLSKKIIIEADIDRLYFYVDEHTTATNGKYELREGLEQELKWYVQSRVFKVFSSYISIYFRH